MSSSRKWTQTHMTKQSVTSHNFANAPKNEKYLNHPTHYGVSYLLLFSHSKYAFIYISFLQYLVVQLSGCSFLSNGYIMPSLN